MTESNQKSDGLPRKQEIEKCPVCGQSDFKTLFRLTDRLHGTPGEYTYVRCERCETIFQNPMVIAEDLHALYPPAYSPHTQKPRLSPANFDLTWKDDQSLPANLQNYVRKAIVDSIKESPQSGLPKIIGSVLAKSSRLRERAFYGLVRDECLPRGDWSQTAIDLGCGTGEMMIKLRQVGWREVEGLEWDESAARAAHENTNLKVWSGDFRETDLPKGKYQLITLSHVFEHIGDPVGVLRRLYELLAPGGKAILFYPNAESLGSVLFKTDWYHWDAPRHLVFPSAGIVRKTAADIGFSSVKVFSHSAYAEEQWIRSKAYRLRLDPQKDRLKLGWLDKLGVLSEHILTKTGAAKGWETVAILEK